MRCSHTVRLHEKIEGSAAGERCVPSASAPVPARWKAPYMPCFLAGRAVARGAHLLSVPLLPCLISRDISRQRRCRLVSWICLTANFLAWHLSGGIESELLHVKCGADGLPDCTCIGGHDRPCSRSAARSRGKSARSAVPVRRRTGRAGALPPSRKKGFKPKVNESVNSRLRYAESGRE